jgi:flagellar motor switch protein FliN/FliY
MAGPDDIPLPNLKGGGASDLDLGFSDDGSRAVAGSEAPAGKVAQDLEHVFDVPVNVSAVLGRTRMEIGDLLRLAPGAVLELDRRVGEAIDIFVNDRLVARGEVVLVEDRLGVTMTEIIKADR